MTDVSSAGSQTQNASGIQIPVSVREKFPQLLELLLASESMNQEERQYWVDILPIMTPEQVQQLNTILQNEHDQLAAIDAKYSAEVQAMNQSKKSVAEIGESRKKKLESRQSQEDVVRQEEAGAAEDILKNME